MKVYAQYYDNRPEQSPVKDAKTWYVEQMGSEQVVILDGRKNRGNLISDAKEHAKTMLKKPAAYRIFRGERFDSNNTPLTGIIPL